MTNTALLSFEDIYGFTLSDTYLLVYKIIGVAFGMLLSFLVLMTLIREKRRYVPRIGLMIFDPLARLAEAYLILEFVKVPIISINTFYGIPSYSQTNVGSILQQLYMQEFDAIIKMFWLCIPAFVVGILEILYIFVHSQKGSKLSTFAKVFWFIGGIITSIIESVFFPHPQDNPELWLLLWLILSGIVKTVPYLCILFSTRKAATS